MRRTLVVALALAGATLHAQSVNRRRDASFKLNGSIWKDGQGIDQTIKLGPTWSKSDSVGFSIDIKTPSFDFFGYTVPSIDLGKTGATLGYDVGAGFGFTAGVKYVDGTADIAADGALVFTFDRDPVAGQPCGVTVSYSPSSSSHLITTSPQLSATLEETVGFEAAITASVDFLDHSLISPNTKILDYKQPNFGFVGHNVFLNGALTNLNDLQAIKLLNQNAPVGIEFKSPDASTNGGVDSGASTMSSYSFSPFVTVSSTLAQLILAFAGGDKLAYFFDGSTTLPSPVALKASWDFAKVSGTLGLGLRHQYTFNPNPHVSLQITPNAAGQTIPGSSYFPDVQLGKKFYFTMPTTGGVTLNGSFAPSPTLRNKVSAAANGNFNITPIALSLKGKLGTGEFSKDIDWTFNPYSYDWTSDTGSLFTVDDRTSDFLVSSKTYPSVQINPAVSTAPTPVVYGDNDATLEYLQAKAYNGFTYGADLPGPYRLQMYSLNSYGFCGLYAGGQFHNSDASSIVFTPETWDGNKVSELVLPSGAGNVKFEQYLAGNSRSNIQVDANAALLRPGNHTLGFTVDATFTTLNPFNSQAYKTHYDIPVTVPLPAILIGSDILTDTTDHARKVNYLDASYTGQELYIDATNSLLETEVVLDDKIVLPTTRYSDVQDNGGKIIPEEGDSTHRVYSDAQEFRWFTGGNKQVSFNIPPSLLPTLAASVHTVRLRTKDPFSDGYVLTSDADSKKLYFPAGAPTISKIEMNDLTQNFPVLNAGYALKITGTNLTATSVVTLTLTGTQYPLAIEYVNPTTIKATVPKEALDNAQANGGSGTISVSTQSFSLTDAFGYGAQSPKSVTSGGVVSTSIAFKMPAPVVTGADPGSPVRDAPADLTVVGSYFSLGATANAQSVVTFDGQTVPASMIEFPGATSTRGLTTMLLHLPASFTKHTGPVILSVKNSGGASAFTVTVSNPAPAISATTPLSVTLGAGGSPPRLSITGGPFNETTTALVDGKPVTIREQTSTSLLLNIPNSINVPSTTVSVINPTPGGGQSAQIPVTILEGDSGLLAVTRGAASFNPLAGTYKQQFTVNYTGGRTLRGKVRVTFTLPAGTTMTDGDGGQPIREFTVDMTKGAVATFTANFKTTSKTVPTFGATVKIG